jgi:uncharacterized damage-inducible protein DinB
LSFGDFHTAIRILNHSYVVDRIFCCHLQRKPHRYHASNTVETPRLKDLDKAIRASDQWFLDYVEDATTDMLNDVIDFDFTDGDHGRLSRTQMLLHLLAHGTYHRGEIGRLLEGAGIDAPRDTLARYWRVTAPD